MLTDMETCYKVMRAEVLRSMKLQSDGFGIEPELTAKIQAWPSVSTRCQSTHDGRGYDEGKKIGWRDGVVARRCCCVLDSASECSRPAAGDMRPHRARLLAAVAAMVSMVPRRRRWQRSFSPSSTRCSRIARTSFRLQPPS